MTITLPNKFDTTKETAYQEYDMRSVIEAIMELNRRTAFMGSNCSFLKAIEKHQTRPEQYDDNDDPVATDNPDQFACNRIKDGLPAARNGEHDVPSDGEGTVITAASITALQRAIETLQDNYDLLLANHIALKNATSIRRFEFTVTFTLDPTNPVYPGPDETWNNPWYVNTFTYRKKNNVNEFLDNRIIDSRCTVIQPRWIASAFTTDTDGNAAADTSLEYTTIQEIATNYDVHLLRIYNGKTHIQGYPVENYITDNNKIKLAFILGSVSTISVVGYPVFKIVADGGVLTTMEIQHTANAGEFKELSDDNVLSLIDNMLTCVIEARPKEVSSD